MQLIKKLPVAVKVLTAVAVAGVVAVIVAVVGIVTSASIADRAHVLSSSGLASVATLGDMRGAMRQTRVDVLQHVVNDTQAGMAKQDAKIAEDDAAMAKAIAAYRASDPAGDPATMQRLEQSWQAYTAARDGEGLPASRRGDTEAFRKVQEAEMLPASQAASAALDELMKAETKAAADMAAATQSTADRARLTQFAVLAVGLLAGLATGGLVARAIAKAATRVKDGLEALADGDLTVAVVVDTEDELGAMARAYERARTNTQEALHAMQDAAATLGGTSEELAVTAQTISASATESSSEATTVSAAAEEVSRNVQSVASGAEEMSASIAEIAGNATEAAKVAAEAVELGEATNQTVVKLGESSREIGDVVKVITSIAEQTNLLALNATIEAARAGSAGKGFAVVASEVKDLAQATSRATTDIATRIEAIQADTARTVESISGISEIVARIATYQTTIASAVEEQTATTAEMTRNVTEAAAGSGQIAGNIAAVAAAADATTGNLVQAEQATAALSDLAGRLTTLVGNFRI